MIDTTNLILVTLEILEPADLVNILLLPGQLFDLLTSNIQE